ncbi:MAG: biotin carboxylase N-terminal domain-containing protein [Actinomycetes bacterium]
MTEGPTFGDPQDPNLVPADDFWKAQREREEAAETQPAVSVSVKGGYTALNAHGELSDASESTISRLLVANRGEIACRVFRTAKDLGITTIAVFSDPDRHALHTRSADVAVSLGGTTSAESYLDTQKILDAARRAGADAIHPGYGFLSENPDFAEAVEAAGLIWVGPTPTSIRAMALKVEAKRIAATAGVPLVPGAEIAVEATDRELIAAAEQVGFPLLVKASAGGGGKGMRMVESNATVLEAVAGARREAASSFGDPTVFFERALVGARHVEVQVFGDIHGNVVHLYERECSIQRRHQKIIEESPSPGTTAATLTKMYAAAVALADAIAYVGAGTVEFLVAGEGEFQEFFFLEMNTRLQVEHPVTEEALLGLDLVRWQLDVAAGARLPKGQDEISRQGHAIEVRLYAEDPGADYLPSTGKVLAFDDTGASSGDAWLGAREELSITAGDEVTQYYDPMIAKIIVADLDRGRAAKRLAARLRARDIVGITTNRDALIAILESDAFLAGATTTDFLDLHPQLPVGGGLDEQTRQQHLVASGIAVAANDSNDARWAGLAPTGWRNVRAMPERTDWQWTAGGSAVDAAILIDWTDGESGSVSWVLPAGTEDSTDGHKPDPAALTGATTEHRFQSHVHAPTPADSSLTAKLSRGFDDQKPRQPRSQRQGARRLAVAVELDGVLRRFVVGLEAGWVWVNDGESSGTYRQLSRFGDGTHDALAGGPSAPVPGTVVAVEVAVGDYVVEGQTLVVLEAMKMEHRIKAAADGVVTEVLVVSGQSVDAHQVLVVLGSSADGQTQTGANND